ncbi:TPA: autotransporter outer membrane beta-barrel domain-containing protein [Escherichia coli]|nr:autotransporter outer membrane beta-barrel domain-containing protein [Escherichia coli]HAV8499963.1 autotransporter outer membrane beta-barrel domain-containing protein [Escherichia coli]
MNNVYKVIWDKNLCCWKVVSELASSLITKSILVVSGAIFLSLNAVADVSSGAAGEVLFSGTTIIDNNAINYDSITSLEDGASINIINGGGLRVGAMHSSSATNSISVIGGGSYFVADELFEPSSFEYGDPLPVLNVSGGGSVIVNALSGWNMSADGNKSILVVDTVSLMRGENISITNGAKMYFGTFAGGMGSGVSSQVIISGDGSELHAQNSAYLPGMPGGERYELIVQDGGRFSSDVGLNAYNSDVVIGAASQNEPVAAGELDVQEITLQSSAAIILNHTEQQYSLNTNLISYSYDDDGDGYTDINEDSVIIKALNGTTTLNGDNTNYNDLLEISSPAQINVNSQKNLGNAIIVNDGTLNVNTLSDWSFSNRMTGNGTLAVNTSGNKFTFRNTKDTQGFTGTLALSDTIFDLSGDNTIALSTASLQADSGSQITVGAGEQNVSGLIFNGGTINFGTVLPGAERTEGIIQVGGLLDTAGGGAVRVDEPGINTISRTINSSLSLMEQDDENATIKLVDASAGRVVGDGGNLHLQNSSGQTITSSQERDIIRNGSLVARGTYDYRLTSGMNNDGLYIGYGLTQLELLTSGADALVLEANGKTGNAADMSARITGTGDLSFSSQKGETVSLSNKNNDYTGVTNISSGNLLMNNDYVLGNTSEIRLAADTLLDMNGHSQTAGKLNGAAGSVLNINGGNLTLTEGGVSAGTLTGSGSLNLSSGEFSITGASSALTATTMVGEKATVKVYDNDALGTGTVNTAGTLILGKVDDPVMLASSQVNITENGILSGYGGVAGNVTNSGTLDLRADAPGNVLTVGGNYTGNNGTLLMNTVLGDDSSATDKLVIKGDASGQTRVAVTNAGGTGAQTLNGIELIHVDGNADSAEFVQASRIAAGAYDYTLGRGQGSNSGNWYLTSGKNTPEPTPTPDPDSKPEPAPGGYDNDLRPEAGSYTANMAAANTMFVTRLHERLGPVQYTDVMTGETKNTSMWMRHEGGHNRWRDGTGQLKTQGNRYVVQLGGDIAQWGWGETDRWHLGVMAGYGNDHNNTDSVRTGYRSKGSVNGYSTGLYATWFANDETHNGAYLDTWAQYGWFDNHVKGDGLPGESWKSKGLTASLETGYTWKAGEFSGSHGSLNEWYVQPQAQVVWMGVKADEHRESNGTRVESTGDGNVRTRLGVKTWIKGHNRMDDGKSREFRPFVEVNWLHNTREFGTRMNGVTVHQDGARNIGEVKAGVEGQINDRLNLWGNVGVQAGDKGYSDTSAMLGVKYTF